MSKVFVSHCGKSLGNVIVEKDGRGLLAMFPDGSVKGYTGYARMLIGVRAWAKRHTSANEITTTSIKTYTGEERHILSTKEVAE